MIRRIFQSIRLYLNRDGKFYGLSYSQLGFIPRNRGLYQLALRHKSASQKGADGVLLNYERLEFLGDAVLSAIVAELLYKFFPAKDEGFLTRVRSLVVSRESLNHLAIHMGLDKAVVANADISRNKHIYGDVFEAFVGAMLLDQGFANTMRFIEKYIFPNFFDLEELAANDRNNKSRLLEWGQKNKVGVRFETAEPRHGRRNKFRCTVWLDGEEKGRGEGASKKEAEQKAAGQVVDFLNATLGAEAGIAI